MNEPPIVRSHLLDAASEDDRLWFERHAGRNHRIRAPIGGERAFLPPLQPGCSWLVIIRQIRPGVRVKASLQWIGAQPLNSERVATRLLSGTPGMARFAAIERIMRGAAI
jgi:hypothetical protein